MNSKHMNFDVEILSILKVITQEFCPGLYIVYRSDHGMLNLSQMMSKIIYNTNKFCTFFFSTVLVVIFTIGCGH